MIVRFHPEQTFANCPLPTSDTVAMAALVETLGFVTRLFGPRSVDTRGDPDGKLENALDKAEEGSLSRSARSRAGRTSVTTVGKKAADLLQNPLARDLIAAGLVTTVATKVATGSARKAAREEVAQGGTYGSPGAILGSAVATVASEAVRRMVSKGTKSASRSKKAKTEAPASATRSNAKKAAAKTSSRTTPTKKRSTSRKAKGR